MAGTKERDFPPGHPKAVDFDPKSPEALEWARQNVHQKGERDFPVDHPKAIDTPGNSNHVQWLAGVDPNNPHLQPFTGKTPEQVAALAEYDAMIQSGAHESPVLEPLDALVANAALEARRKELKVDVLTSEQYTQVIAELHEAARRAMQPEARSEPLRQPETARPWWTGRR